MANALHSNRKAKHPSGYIQGSGMKIYEQHDDLDQSALARTKCQQWPSFQSSLIPNWNAAQYFLCTWSSSVSERLKCYTVYLKMFFFPNWILSESSITELFRAVFPPSQANIKLCLTTYDSVFQTFLKCNPFCLICLPATLPFPPALLLPRHQDLHFSSAGEQNQAVITVYRNLLTPTS